jgi:Uma2 family endonuclease
VVSRRVRGRWLARQDAVLVVEVSQTSIRRDLGPKARDYALWGAPAYWVVDLTRGELVTHAGPRPDGTWTEARVCKGGERLMLPEIEADLLVRDLLPTQ